MIAGSTKGVGATAPRIVAFDLASESARDGTGGMLVSVAGGRCQERGHGLRRQHRTFVHHVADRFEIRHSVCVSWVWWCFFSPRSSFGNLFSAAKRSGRIQLPHKFWNADLPGARQGRRRIGRVLSQKRKRSRNRLREGSALELPTARTVQGRWSVGFLARRERVDPIRSSRRWKCVAWFACVRK